MNNNIIINNNYININKNNKKSPKNKTYTPKYISGGSSKKKNVKNRNKKKINICNNFLNINTDNKTNKTDKKEIIKELKNSDINMIQGMSYESQLLISNINSPFSNTFSFNKSDLKLMNKINFDMPISVDLDKIDTEDSKKENKNHKKNKIYHHLDNGPKVKSNKKENILQSITDTHNSYNCKNSKIEKLENFINKLNADENTRNINNINSINNENQQYLPTQSMTTEKLIKNNNEVFIVEDGLINNKNKNNKLNNKSTDNEIKNDSNNLNNLNYNNGFYDDIVIKDEIDNIN